MTLGKSLVPKEYAMFRPRSRRKSVGVTLIEVLAATSIMSGLQSQSGGNLRYGITKAREVQGISNLRQLHMLLMMQCMASPLPNAAFYPEGDPKTDPKSIMKLIPDAPPALFLSPIAPDPLQAKGLTFAWNTAVNGKTLDSLPGNTWLLADLAAFIADPKVARPGKYLVLYANGKAEAVTELPAEIVQAVQEAAKSKGVKTEPAPKTKAATPAKPADPTKGLNRRIPSIPNLPTMPGI
jgi:hypothetical protein